MVWVCAAVSSTDAVEELVTVLIGRLGGAGLNPIHGIEQGPGCLIVNEMTAALFAEIAAAAAGGSRLIALATSGDLVGRGTTWRLLAAGAADVLVWTSPGCLDQVVQRLRRWEEVDVQVGSKLVRRQVRGVSAEWAGTLREVVEVARYSRAPVLLAGESGTGKELLARLVHELDHQASGPLVVVDCTTITPTLLGSELFGHERGAFTGAVSTRDGAVAGAGGGTLLLDEIGELPADLQPALLRVVQEGTYKRVGSDRWLHTSFRLVCATNRDLPSAVAAGTFRADLYYRIAAAVVQVPPLRHRPDDIVPLFRHFLAEQLPGTEVELTEPVSDLLLTREYPGNVRELRQLALRVAARHVGTGAITPGDIPPAQRPAAAELPWSPAELEAPVRRALAGGAGLDDVRRATVDLAYRLALADGGSTRAASIRLGVTERAVQLWQKDARQRWRDRADGVLAPVGDS